MARTVPSPAFRKASRSSSTSWEFSALRRSGRCNSMVNTASVWLIAIMGARIYSLVAVSRITTDQLRDAVLDEGSFLSWDVEPLAVSASESYARELAEARAATGRDESVLTGEGRMFGRRVAVVVCEF